MAGRDRRRPLAGKVAFVAGASRGIGRNIAVALAGAGAAVVVAARSQAEGRVPGTIHSVAAMIRDAGGEALPVVCDVTDEQSVESAVERAVEVYGGLDVVVSNAGVMWLASTVDTPLKRWELCLRVNLTGVFLVTRACLPHVRSPGSLIAVTTTGVRMTDLGSNAYWVAKAGVERYYLGLASEMRDRNVAVNCLAPSKVVVTEGWLAAGGWELPDDEIEPPEAMGAAAVVLASQDASGITGTVQQSLDLARHDVGAPRR
jgi:citronellol/citronellal dehydrogenase